MKSVEKIAATPVDVNLQGESSSPKEKVIIQDVKIIVK
jgi:hypothetical protein